MSTTTRAKRAADDHEDRLARSLRAALSHSTHDARTCADPGGWYPERCSCWVAEARDVLALHDEIAAEKARRGR